MEDIDQLVKETDETESSKPHARRQHVAVCLHSDVIVFGGCSVTGRRGFNILVFAENHDTANNHLKILNETTFVSHRVIWMYNSDTHLWRKYVISGSHNIPPGSRDVCGVAIGDDVYMHGGITAKAITTALWKLARTTNGINWEEIKFKHKHLTPSNRCSHTGWEYGGKMWIFGGYGASFHNGFLADHGDMSLNTNGIGGYNNQVLYFNPTKQKWTNAVCQGEIPSARALHAVSRVHDSIWLYGGISCEAFTDDLCVLNMNSLVWTEIQKNWPLKPMRCYGHSFTAIGDSQIILHGGKLVYQISDDHHQFMDMVKGFMFGHNDYMFCNPSWILDLSSLSWRKHTGIKDHTRSHHTGTTAGDSVVIFGGGSTLAITFLFCTLYKKTYSDMICISQGPKSMKNLCLRGAHKHQAVLKHKWHTLPRSLQECMSHVCKSTEPDKCNSGIVNSFTDLVPSFLSVLLVLLHSHRRLLL